MNDKSVIENTARLKELLHEKLIYKRFMSPKHSIIYHTMEDDAITRRRELLNILIEDKEKRIVSSLMEFVADKRFTIDIAAKGAGMSTEKFIKISQEIISEKERAENDRNNSKSADYKPLTDSERKSIIMRYINEGYSIPVVAAYTYKTVDSIEEITGLKSEVSQLEYDIINNLLKFRPGIKKEIVIKTIINLIYDGILSISEAADRMNMKLDEFLIETGLIEKCSSDGNLMIKTSTDRIIEKCMNSLTSNVNTNDIILFDYLISTGLYSLTPLIIDHINKTSNEKIKADN